jgi:hypothetical protein
LLVENGPKIMARQAVSGSFDFASRDTTAGGSAQDDISYINQQYVARLSVDTA